MSRFNVEDLLLDIDVQVADYLGTGVTRRYSTYSDLGWILSDVTIGSLTRKESYVSLPHANDVIDFSEYTGTPHYEPREVRYTFWRQGASRSNMLLATKAFEEIWRGLSVNSRDDKIYDPTIYGNVRHDDHYVADYWARPRCVSFERKYNTLSWIAEVTVTLKVYPLPQTDPIS